MDKKMKNHIVIFVVIGLPIIAAIFMGYISIGLK